MNTHFSLRTDGAYLRKMPNNPSYSFIKLFIEQPGNDQANNYLLMGIANGSINEVIKTVQEDGNAEQILFHFDDNDETEIYWYDTGGWHCIITVQNEGRSIILTRTHAKYKRESTEYVFYPFSN